jgi:hypothetical protein
MVAMGGGSELPLRGRELVLAVLPWPQSELGNAVKEIEEEFPDVELHYIHEKRTQDRPDQKGNIDVPEGKLGIPSDRPVKAFHISLFQRPAIAPAVLLR